MSLNSGAQSSIRASSVSGTQKDDLIDRSHPHQSPRFLAAGPPHRSRPKASRRNTTADPGLSRTVGHAASDTGTVLFSRSAGCRPNGLSGRCGVSAASARSGAWLTAQRSGHRAQLASYERAFSKIELGKECHLESWSCSARHPFSCASRRSILSCSKCSRADRPANQQFEL